MQTTAGTEAILNRSEEEKVKLASETVTYLNELLVFDQAAVQRLFDFYTDCESEIGYHPTVQTVEVQRAQPTFVVGLLGILNGLIGIRDHVGYITAVYDGEPQRLVRFELTTEANRLALNSFQAGVLAAVKKTTEKPVVKAGWAWPPAAKKMHYFTDDHRSLCLEWAYSGERISLDVRTYALETQCKVCWRRRAKMVSSVGTEPTPKA